MIQINTIRSTFFTLSILMGTMLHSFGFDGRFNELDSNKAILVDGETRSTRISTPTVSMYRRADREIAVNMNEEIKSTSKKKITTGSVHQADVEINYKFYNQFWVNVLQWPSVQEDENLYRLFNAENIKFSTCIGFEAADNLMHGQFIAEHLF